MKFSYTRSLMLIRIAMIAVNLLNILFYSSLVLLTTKYIINNQLAREFLGEAAHMPRHPLEVFFGSLALFALLILIIYLRNKGNVKSNSADFLYSISELAIGFSVIYLLYMDYNGIFLLIICDCIYNFKKSDVYKKAILAVIAAVYLIANYDVFSYFIPITNLEQYFKVYDANIRGLLMIARTLLEVLNIVLFIIFMIVYLAAQIQEKAKISKKLLKILSVNKELQNYAVITEKIGENNERKRLAREIHDTVGHALAGIAAGVDACIIMIDNNPQAVKKQLRVISKVVREGMSDVRNSLNKLRPGALEQHGLKDAICNMIEEFASISNIKINLDYRLENVDFEKIKEDVLFRIVQECVTNSVRHGGASNIDIHIYKKGHVLYLKIKDNGIGCEKIHCGFGLKQMKERVSIINGSISFDGSDGFLTTAKIPMRKGEIYD